MGKLLGGLFVGVFAGALVYEVVKRVKPDLAQKCADGVNGSIKQVADLLKSAKAPANNGVKKKSIPIV